MSTVKTNEKWRAVETALTQIERQFGKGSIMRLGDNRSLAEVGVISTGSLASCQRTAPLLRDGVRKVASCSRN